jgi:hypothetical protein
MKRYLIRLCCFFVPVLVLLFIMEVMLRRIPNDYSLKHERMHRDGASLQFLVLGNSHAYKGVDPDRMGPNGFNAANISQDYRLDRAVLERYINGMPHVKHVFIPVSYGSLGARLEDGQEAWRVKNYALYMGIAPLHFDLQHHLELLNRPMVAQWRMIRDHWVLGKDNVLCSTSGIGIAREGGQVDLASNGKAAALRHRRSNGASERNVDLEAIIVLATERGVHVHLSIPPAWVTYRSELDPAQLANVRRTCQRLRTSTPLVTFDDLLADRRFVEGDFSDADHLSSAGAIKLSAILAEHLREP